MGPASLVFPCRYDPPRVIGRWCAGTGSLSRSRMQKPEAALAAANAALEAGRLQEAREHAQAAVDGARGDLRLEAQALACLAHCDRIGSRLRRASTTARRAAQIFEHLGDAQGEA